MKEYDDMAELAAKKLRAQKQLQRDRYFIESLNQNPEQIKDEVGLQIQKLFQITEEMQNRKNYYTQPQRAQQICAVAPGKQQEWISRLEMVKESLKEAIK